MGDFGLVIPLRIGNGQSLVVIQWRQWFDASPENNALEIVPNIACLVLGVLDA